MQDQIYLIDEIDLLFSDEQMVGRVNCLIFNNKHFGSAEVIDRPLNLLFYSVNNNIPVMNK
jgi:hypothetical protein